MNRLEIDLDYERLTITRPAPAGRMLLGFVLLCFTLACLTPLGILGVIQDRPVHANVLRASPDTLGFMNPDANHFGFLWLLGIGIVALAVPLFAAHIRKASTVFCFDRATNRFTRNGKPLSSLSKIEAIRIRRCGDSDDRPLFHLYIQHSDGFEVEIDEWYDEAEIRVLARDIADWTKAEIVAPEASSWECPEVVPADPWRWS